MIKIEGKELNFRYNFGALYLFEEISGSTFNEKKTQHWHLLFYCMLLYGNKGVFEMKFDEFVDFISENRDVLTAMESEYLEQINIVGQNAEADKKKVRAKKK